MNLSLGAKHTKHCQTVHARDKVLYVLSVAVITGMVKLVWYCLARRSPSSQCVFGSYFVNSFDINIPKILQLLFFMLNSNFLIWNFTIMTCSFFYLVCKHLSLSWYLTGENPESWRRTETPTEGTSRNGKVATSWGKKKVGLPCKTRASLVGTDGLWTFFSCVIFFGPFITNIAVI